MRLKLDENITASAIAYLRRGGHDVSTVREDGLGGASDTAVFAACIAEDRTLVTLDRDFGQILRFPPERTAGIVILELGAPASVDRVLGRLADFLALARSRSVRSELWIVEPGRVRVHLAKGHE